MEWKYIVLSMEYDAGERLGNGVPVTEKVMQEIPVIFPKFLVHKDVADISRVRSIRRNFDSIVAAGFCHIDSDGNWNCYGESESLRIESRETDSQLLNNYPSTRGIFKI